MANILLAMYVIRELIAVHNHCGIISNSIQEDVHESGIWIPHWKKKCALPTNSECMVFVSISLGKEWLTPMDGSCSHNTGLQRPVLLQEMFVMSRNSFSRFYSLLWGAACDSQHPLTLGRWDVACPPPSVLGLLESVKPIVNSQRSWSGGLTG